MNQLITGLMCALALSACTATVTTDQPGSGQSSQQALVTTQSVGSSAAPAMSSTASEASPSATGSTLDACLHYSGHVFEVCTAYIANSSLAVLVPYYAYGTSSNTTLARYAHYRLGSRYTGQAYRLITARVASWPAGTHDVAVPDIRILSVQSNLSTNTATLQTEESWKVTTENGQVLFQENDMRHTVTMHRVSSYVLHKWVVTNLR